jgi:hypothetical protein
MMITPYVGDIAVSTKSVTIAVNPADRERIDDLVMSACTISKVSDDKTYQAARNMAGQLKSMLNEISDAAKSAKRPGNEVNDAISQLAKDISQSVVKEQTRILGLITRYVAKLEQEKAKRMAEQRAREEEAQRAISEARAAAALATSEAQKARAQLDLARAELAREIVKSTAQAEEEKPLAPGGRVTHPWKFRVTDPNQVVAKYGLSLFRWELDILACQDLVKAQLEKNPGCPPEIAGIEVSRETKVTINATAKTL